MMKKLLAMALALTLCLGLAVPALAAEEKTDVVFVQDESGLLWPATDLPEPEEVFQQILDDYGYDLPEPEEVFQQFLDDYGYDLPEPDEEPTLTLMVNGVASDIAISANDWTTYADAADLRSLLGDKAVAPDYEGPVPIREAAENAGWDVEWYDGGWWSNYQEIQLWDKAAFEAQLDEEFGPFNDFLAKVMGQSMDLIFSEEATSGHQSVDVDLTRFSTLDGDKKYTLTLTLDYILQKGVMDMTVTFDVSQLLQFYAPGDLAAMARAGGFDLAQLTQLLKAGKMEFILDYDQGAVAYNVPLLALIDEDMEGWQTHYLYDWDKEALLGGEELSLTSILYASMVEKATRSWIGAEEALVEYEASVRALRAFVGKDCFTTQNGKTTWSVTTQAVNRVIGEALELEEPETASFFKACQLTYSLDDQGKTDMKLHIRPDMEGIAAAAAEGSYDSGFNATASLVRQILSVFDMDVTASDSGNQSHSASQLSVHWNNVGKLDMRTQTTAGATAQSPRQIKDVERLWVEPTPGTVLTALGIIGGPDGPTGVFPAVAP